MQVLVKLPSRNRPEKLTRVLGMYRSMLSGKHGVVFLVSADNDDRTMNCPSIRYLLGQMPDVHLRFGHHRNKVEAVNAHIGEFKDWDILLVASDDMIPQVDGYDDIICADMMRYFPDLCGVLHYNDGFVGKKLMTLPVLGRNYYNAHGEVVYDKGYQNLWCDNDTMEMAQGQGLLVYIHRVVIRHEHPGNMKSIRKDALYKRNDRTNTADHAHYQKRKAANFGLAVPP